MQLKIASWIQQKDDLPHIRFFTALSVPETRSLLKQLHGSGDGVALGRTGLISWWRSPDKRLEFPSFCFSIVLLSVFSVLTSRSSFQDASMIAYALPSAQLRMRERIDRPPCESDTDTVLVVADSAIKIGIKSEPQTFPHRSTPEMAWRPNRLPWMTITIGVRWSPQIRCCRDSVWTCCGLLCESEAFPFMLVPGGVQICCSY